MIDFEQLEADLSNSPIANIKTSLIDSVNLRMGRYTHGEFAQWQALLDGLPALQTQSLEFNSTVRIGSQQELAQQLSPTDISAFKNALKTLIPWRKGPFELFGIQIDTEWRSDWKWDRLIKHISPLKDRCILDVGCGSGYHCWRMLGEQAKLVIGIDPSQKFLAQFSVVKKYAGNHPAHLLPIGIEDMPAIDGTKGFDSIFSMGVLYHRKSPMDHLQELKHLLAKGGELILETLVIDGDQNQVLVPQDRYAQMNNVWFIPSIDALTNWLNKCGYKNIRFVNVNQTSEQEQRATEWMPFHSLVDFLDPADKSLTLEGYPAPKRATLVANR